MVMVGDFAPQGMLELVEKVFASWAPGKVDEAPNPALPDLHGRHVVLVHLPGAVQAQIVVGQSGHHAPSTGLGCA